MYCRSVDQTVVTTELPTLQHLLLHIIHSIVFPIGSNKWWIWEEPCFSWADRGSGLLPLQLAPHSTPSSHSQCCKRAIMKTDCITLEWTEQNSTWSFRVLSCCRSVFDFGLWKTSPQDLQSLPGNICGINSLILYILGQFANSLSPSLVPGPTNTKMGPANSN